jgi:hypothetical protein
MQNSDEVVRMQHVRDEYTEMPGLNLSAPQAARLLDVPIADAEHLLSEMVDEHFLERDTDGLYRRRDR